MELSDVQVNEFDLPSDRSTIVIDAGGENFIVSGVACCEAFDPIAQTALARRIAAGDILVMQGNLQGAATNACLRAARENGARTVLNASPIGESGSAGLRSSGCFGGESIRGEGTDRQG